MTAAIAEPEKLSAVEAVEAIRDGRLTSRELVEACLARIDAREATVKAWHFLDADLPRKEAGTRDTERPHGPLHGLPIGVKDIFSTAEMPTKYGSPIYSEATGGADAACVTCARSTGALVMGKTATTEFAAFTPTDTTNPLNAGHTPGGSSSGSAAAVADCMVPLAIGTQTAGSVIRPASFCGIVGYKPTFGTIDRRGLMPFADSLDTVGVFARGVADAALFAGALAGWKKMATPPEASAPRRVLVVRAPQWGAATEEVDAAVTSAAKAIEAAGVPVSETAMPGGFEDMNRLQDILQVYEGRRALAWERLSFPERLSEGLRGHFARMAEVTFEEYMDVRREQERWIARFGELLEPGDVLLTASAPGEAPAGLSGTGDPVFCRPWTFLQIPCVSLPHGTGPAGLPLGVQLIARRWGDADLLGAARFVEAQLK